ncbi:MAG: NAD+ synthase [Bacteroidales bacterium]|nr:NAD+ synthase [Bacteroidales bacterium]
MKIALAQLNYIIGDFENNSKHISAHINLAKREGADLVIFSELALTGYPPRDFLEFDDFIDRTHAQIEQIARKCRNIACILGAPSRNPSYKGKKLFNSAYFLADGEIKQIIHKTLLPNYDIFDEYRYFEANSTFNVIEYKGLRLALTICEDLWDLDDDTLYRVSPMEKLMEQQPDLMINIAASPFDYNQFKNRRTILERNVEKFGLPVVYVNHVGAQTELLFDGGSMVMDSQGTLRHQMAYFTEEVFTFETEEFQVEKEKARFEVEENPIGLIHDALVMGIRNYFEKLGFKKAILGLSGGIDSAVTLVLAVKALGTKNVMSVLLPSQYSTGHSVSDSEQLVKNLRSPHKVVGIKDIYKSFEQTLEPYFEGRPFDVTEENIQARTRAVILMAFSNKFGYILLNTSNKSEAAVGYGTLYGDMCGGLSVLGDVYKTQVYELARYINRKEVVIPESIITKAPSAELRPDQKDQDSLPEYDVLDEILYQYIEKRKGPAEIINMGFDKAIVEKTLKLVNINEWKRHQTPPILRVSKKAFGMGRRMPIVAKYLA